jgi:hypothetical protein
MSHRRDKSKLQQPRPSKKQLRSERKRQQIHREGVAGGLMAARKAGL